jgi:hypothetical protein
VCVKVAQVLCVEAVIYAALKSVAEPTAGLLLICL